MVGYEITLSGAPSSQVLPGCLKDAPVWWTGVWLCCFCVDFVVVRYFLFFVDVDVVVTACMFARKDYSYSYSYSCSDVHLTANH